MLNSSGNAVTRNFEVTKSADPLPVHRDSISRFVTYGESTEFVIEDTDRANLLTATISQAGRRLTLTGVDSSGNAVTRNFEVTKSADPLPVHRDSISRFVTYGESTEFVIEDTDRANLLTATISQAGRRLTLTGVDSSGNAVTRNFEEVVTKSADPLPVHRDSISRFVTS